MAVDVVIKKLSEVYIQLVCEPYIKKELEPMFVFRPPGYQFVPSYKNRMWDGKIRLLDVNTGIIYAGLANQIKEAAESRGYSVKLDFEVKQDDIPDNAGYSLAEDFNCKFPPRDYQNTAVVHALRNKRGLLLSPTGSGKSLIIYLLTRHLSENLNKKVLIVVPSVSLVTQLRADFVDYNRGKDFGIYTISAGESKQSSLQVVISTWQSLLRVTKDYLSQYDAVIIDEAHQAKSASITKLLQKMPDVVYRYGLTGTIDDTGPVNKVTLEGLFSDVYYVTKTHKLIEEKTLSDFKINSVIVKHPCNKKFTTYQDEIDFIVDSQARLKFVTDMAKKLNGNTLILFNYVEKHGVPLYEALKDCGKNVHFIHGGINKDEREGIRKALEKSNDNVLVASFGTTAVGVNIVNLSNLIFAHPTKSKIRSLQSIGRILRKNGDDLATLYDLVDVFDNSTFSYGAKHYAERLKHYKAEKFEVKEFSVTLKSTI